MKDGETREEEENSDDEDEDKKMERNTSPEYRRLITITAGKPKGTLKDALKVEPDKVRRLSLSELQLEKATLSHAKDILRYLVESLSLLENRLPWAGFFPERPMI